MQPFCIEISDDTSSSDDIMENEHFDHMSVPEPVLSHSTDQPHTQLKATEEDIDQNLDKEPTPPVPSIDGAYSIVKSAMPLSSLLVFIFTTSN